MKVHTKTNTVFFCRKDTNTVENTQIKKERQIYNQNCNDPSCVLSQSVARKLKA